MAACFLLPSLRSQPKRLNLSNKNLQTLPTLIGQLVCVNHMQLQFNNLTDLPKEFGDLVQLEYVNLGKNLLSSIPLALQHCSNLRTLHLFSNQLSSLTPQVVLGGLRSLTLLNLNNNCLRTLPTEIFRLAQLTFLSIDHNELEELPFELCALTNLRDLHLAFNRLTSLPLEFGYLISLRRLHLQGNQLKELPEGLCKCIHLKVLDVAANQLRILPTEFCTSLSLQEFHCEANPLLRSKPVNSVQEEEVLSLKEISARFVMRQLKDRWSVVRRQIVSYPAVRDMLSQSSKCAICRESFLNTWLECVTFTDLRKTLHNKKLPAAMPIRALLCSYKCFNTPGHNYYGVAFP